LGSGSGRSKKEAEQKAAEIAWTELNRRANAVLSSEVEPAGPDTDESDHVDPGEDELVNRQDA